MAELLKFMAGTHHDLAAACGIGGADAAAAHDDTAGGEVGAFDVRHQIRERCLGIVQHADARADHLPQIVGRNIGGHTHGDTAGAVHQQVGEAAGQYPGLLAAFIKVGIPVDGVLLNVAQHLIGELGKSRFGITVGGRGVAVHAAEVAVTVDQRMTQGEILCQTDQRVVHGGVTVGVIAAEHVTDGGGALAEGFIIGQAVLIHTVEDTAMYRLQTVAHIGQGTAYDHGHGILNIGALHLRHKGRFHNVLVGKPNFFGIVLGFLTHVLSSLRKI